VASRSVARGGEPRQTGGGGAARGTGDAAWEAVSYHEGCAHARARAGARLGVLEARLHAARPAGYAVVGWRTRTLATRMGDVRVARRLYRAADGTAHFLLDERLGWPPRQAATPEYAALLVDFATGLPYADAARRLAAATAGTLGGDTTRRLLRRLTGGVVAAEQAAHAACVAAGAGPEPARPDVPPVLFAEADGVWVPTQREPAHRHGYELKCASAYEGWREAGRPTPGHPRPHYRLVAKQVYCHAHDQDVVPFWEGAGLHLARTYDLARLPLVVVGGDGANWIDGAADVFWRTVRQRDGFHLARDAARGWGAAAGAQLYEVLRAGDQPTALELLALPPPPRAAAPAASAPLALPPPAPPGGRPAPGPGGPAPAPARRARWSRAQVARARTAVTGQVATADAGADWRRRVAPHEVPPGARALGTQEGTNAHLLARRMKRRGCSWTVPGARAMAKARELVANGALAPWCLRALPAPPPPRPPAATSPGAPRRASPGRPRRPPPPTAPPATPPSPTSSACSPAGTAAEPTNLRQSRQGRAISSA
jgi:Uncharacterised protein family (UPF0236)